MREIIPTMEGSGKKKHTKMNFVKEKERKIKINH